MPIGSKDKTSMDDERVKGSTTGGGGGGGGGPEDKVGHRAPPTPTSKDGPENNKRYPKSDPELPFEREVESGVSGKASSLSSTVGGPPASIRHGATGDIVSKTEAMDAVKTDQQASSSDANLHVEKELHRCQGCHDIVQTMVGRSADDT